MSDNNSKNPRVNSEGAKELDKVQKQFNEFDQQVKDLTLDRMNAAPKEEVESQTKLSSNEINKVKDVYLKAARSATSREKFNERYRDDYNFQKEYVNFIAENREVIGDTIEIWTKPFPGIPAEFWQVPVNKPVWGPRYLAEKIKKCAYHRLTMEERSDPSNLMESYGFAQRYGKIVVDSVIQRLDAIPVTKKKSIFMGREAI